MFMGDVGSEIFAADDKPPISKSVFHFFLDDPCHFAVLLSLEYALDVSNFLNG